MKHWLLSLALLFFGAIAWADGLGGSSGGSTFGQVILGPAPVTQNVADTSAVLITSGPVVIHSTSTNNTMAFQVLRAAAAGVAPTGGNTALSVNDSGAVVVPNTLAVGSNQGATALNTTLTGSAKVTGGIIVVSSSAMSGSLTMNSQSTITIQGSAFSVGTSTFAVANGSVTIGTVTIGGIVAPPDGYALCFSLTGQLGHCTSTPTNGPCTCVSP